MHTRNEVLERVLATVSEVLSVPIETLTEATRVAEDLGADSMDIVTLAISFDDMFDVELDLSDLPESGTTIGWIADYIIGMLR